MGRSSKYSDAIVEKICQRIADGESIRDICADKTMPHVATFFRWMAREENTALREQYARAREMQADAIFDEILSIADDARNDWMERQRDDGSVDEVFNSEHVQRSKLRIDARKWMAGKLRPKVYGDKVGMDMTVNTGDALTQLLESVAATGKRVTDEN